MSTEKKNGRVLVSEPIGARPNLPLQKLVGNLDEDARRAVFNATTQAFAFRQKFMQMFLDRRRNIEHECGYPDTGELTAEEYKRLYDRDPIARKVVDILPQYTWQVPPEVCEEEDSETETPFELSFKQLDDQLQGGSFFKQDESRGSIIWEYLARADRLCGIGHYGVVLLGLDDNKELSEPVQAYKKEGHDKERHKLLFLRVFDEDTASIAKYVTDPKDPRYGLPETYRITICEEVPPGQVASTEKVTFVTRMVHWTRVVHITDGLESSEVIGCPRMRPVYNRLYDLHKLYGGSAEMFWVAAFFGLSFETQPELLGQVDIDTDDMKQQIEAWQNSLQRYFSMPGINIKSIAPQVSDPSPQIERQIEAICIYLRCAKRIFMGSERGQLASGQDADDWRDTIQTRRLQFALPRIVVAFIDHCIKLGVLVKPQESYQVKWKEDETLTLKEQAEVSLAKTQAIVAYLQGSGMDLIDPLDFLVRVMQFTEEEAEAIIDNRMSTLMPEETEPMTDEFGQPMVDEEGNAIPQPKPGKQLPGEDNVDPKQKQAVAQAAKKKSTALRSDKDREFAAKSQQGASAKNKPPRK